MFSRNSNAKVVKIYFNNFCHNFKARFLKTRFFALRKDILIRICPIEVKFSAVFVVLSKFCRMSIELFLPLHFVEVMH